MALPAPVPGLVIRYSYLWHAEHLSGHDEGVKDRPCAIIVAMRNDGGDEVITVLPITHAAPKNPALALEIPAATKARLGLDTDRSWIVLTEANRFIWPGPDLRPAGSNPESVAYGLLPQALFTQIKERFVAILKAGRAKAVSRTG